VVEGARLESVYAGNRIEGSNPSPSANASRSHLKSILWMFSAIYGTLWNLEWTLYLTLFSGFFCENIRPNTQKS
jgi:hypothetical protein